MSWIVLREVDASDITVEPLQVDEPVCTGSVIFGMFDEDAARRLAKPPSRKLLLICGACSGAREDE